MQVSQLGWVGALLALVALLGQVSGAVPTPLPTPPCQGGDARIDLWYGDVQPFARVAQRFVNLLGTVVTPEPIMGLTYHVDGSAPQPLALGPDGRRLLGVGDFNIELAMDELRTGPNCVMIEAQLADGARIHRNVTVMLGEAGAAPAQWQLPLELVWPDVASLPHAIQQSVQVVDGRWQITPAGIRTAPNAVGYDRLLALGDVTWRDVEVLVPVTVYAVDWTALGSPISSAPGVGINLRWLGHSDAPIRCAQPRCGWYPTGGSAWYDFGRSELQIDAAPPKGVSATTAAWEMGQTYWFKVRVTTTLSGCLYQFKRWPVGEFEPDGWTLARLTGHENPPRGAILLVAHHVDAAFGPVTVTAVTGDDGVRSWWEPFVALLALAAQWPKLVVIGLGLLLARRLAHTQPRVSRLMYAALALWLVEICVTLLTERYLGLWLHGWGRTTRQITLARLWVEHGSAALHATAWLLLLVALWQAHKPNTT